MMEESCDTRFRRGNSRGCNKLIFSFNVPPAIVPTGYSRISAPSPSGILTTLKILADHYPERLAKAFIVDASSVFYYVWKVRIISSRSRRRHRSWCIEKWTDELQTKT